jgi:glycine oxidase
MKSLGGDVAIIGGGLIGLSIAFELAQRGATVRLYDRGEPGRGASWAGAGMLAPYTERIEDTAMLELCKASLAMYPAFAQHVAERGGTSIEVNLDGIVEAAFDVERFEELQAIGAQLRTCGIRTELLDRRAAFVAEPSLGKRVVGALLLHGQGYVDNRRLGRALYAACIALGVTIYAPVHDVSIECDERRVLGVRSERGFAAAAIVVNAAGAWAAQIPGVPTAACPPVVPVKGQMLALAAPAGFLRRTTWVPGAYLVPRPDGRLLIGATVEPEEGYDTRVTAGGIQRLLDAALAAAPALGAFTVSESWAGLRPGTPDERPFLGPTVVEGLVLATGHYRNGILLTPITAALVTNFIETGDPAPLAEFMLREGNDQRRSA